MSVEDPFFIPTMKPPYDPKMVRIHFESEKKLLIRFRFLRCPLERDTTNVLLILVGNVLQDSNKPLSR